MLMGVIERFSIIFDGSFEFDSYFTYIDHNVATGELETIIPCKSDDPIGHAD